MADVFIWVAVGAFIGWNLPQPFWATFVQTKVKEFFKKQPLI